MAAREGASPHQIATKSVMGRDRWQWVLILLMVGLATMVGSYQLPARHTVDVGGYDAAYVQGFHDAQWGHYASGRRPYLEGSDGRVRWSRARSYLVFPSIGQPATLTIRLRGWRPSSHPPPVVQLLLDGRQVLQTIQTSTNWETYPISVPGAYRKPSDVVIELRSETTMLEEEGREVGVLVDAATYQTTQGFIVPHPLQVGEGMVAMVLLWMLLALASPPITFRVATVRVVLVAGCVGGGFVCCYRLSLYPIRGFLLLLNALLLIGLTIWLLPRWLPRWFTRHRWLAGAGGIGGVVGWFIAVIAISQDHLTLSVPGVEKDFRVFATRALNLALVFQPDGFYPPGYPFLLWLVHPLTAGNVFLAARLIAAASAAVMLGGAIWLAYSVLDTPDNSLSPPYGPILVFLILASNPLVVQYALYVGSDMPFAAAVTLSLATLLHVTSHLRRSSPPAHNHILITVGIAGGVAGIAFLLRHPGLILLPWGVLTCFLIARRPILSLLFAGGFLSTAAPLLVMNTLQTGHPLFNHQAKNIWLAVYGNTDWGRWGEVPDTIGLTEIILQDPVRFARNWMQNIRSFFGTGAEDTSEHGRAVQLRLLGWPANWLAIAGGMLWGGNWLLGRRTEVTPLLTFLLLYVPILCVGFILPRFFLPLVPIYAVAAVSAIRWCVARWGGMVRLSETGMVRTVVVIGIGILVCSDASSGARFVLEHQPDDERAIIRLTLEVMQPGEQVFVRVPASVPIAKYSALAHLTRTFPEFPDEATAIQQLEHHPEIRYVLRVDAEPLPPLPRGIGIERVGEAGRFALYRLVRDEASSLCYTVGHARSVYHHRTRSTQSCADRHTPNAPW